MWRRARRNSPPSPYWFIDLQTALAIDILLHVPLRIEDLGALKFDDLIVHWPQGKGRPAFITLRQAKVPMLIRSNSNCQHICLIRLL